MKRLMIAFFYDKDGIIDDYMVTLLKGLRPHSSHTIFVSNGPITKDSRSKIENGLVDRIIIRENIGFDVWAYKAAIEAVGYEALAEWDEVILLNHTCYGPIYPFSEMFDEMAARKCGFWGITAHKEVIPNPFLGTGRLPMHLNSHFIAIRREMATSDAFRKYWTEIPMIETYVDSVLKHESLFTEHFVNLGYKLEIFSDPDDFGSQYSCFIDIDESIKKRLPILKRRLFFQDPVFLEANAVNLPRALRIIEKTSDYDMEQVWKNITRSSEHRNLTTNAALIKVLPDDPTRRSRECSGSSPRIAVCAHVYYVEMLDEIFSYTNNIRQGYDLVATTDTAEKEKAILERAASEPLVNNVIVRVGPNRGRDMSALFITCRDLFLDDQYDLVCRVHTKKTPQVSTARSNLFKYHLMDNILNSPGYVQNLTDLFQSSDSIGVAAPPIVHMSYPTMGHSWFENKPKTLETAKIVGLNVPFDEDTPIATYGSMFWFRPRALRKLFAHPWRFEDFADEPFYGDGDLAHALERLISYTAQDAGYRTMTVMCPHQAEHNYGFLEFKLQKLASRFPGGDFRWQAHMLDEWRKSGYPIKADGATETVPYGASSVKQALRNLILALKLSFSHRYPRTFVRLRPLYRTIFARPRVGAKG